MIKKFATYSIILGVLFLAINLVFGANAITMINTRIVAGREIYYIDFWGYLSNIKTNITDTAILTLATPTRHWQTFDISNLGGLGNNLALMLDWVLFAINILVYPFRLAFYIIRVVFTVVGINFVNPAESMQWLVNLTNFMINLQIAYV